jgi:predicted adenine nucleotide alpha hydrolase (AANH) superfamily ATPase
MINKIMYLYNKNIMTKREYLLKVLEQLEPVWDLAA